MCNQLKTHHRQLFWIPVNLIMILLVSGFSVENQHSWGNPGSNYQETDLISFSDFGYTDQSLQGPYSSISYEFGIPYSWKLISTPQLYLDMGVFFNVPKMPPEATETHVLGGIVQVIINKQIIATITLDSTGDRLERIVLPPDVMAGSTEEVHLLEIVLNSDETCLFNVETSIVIRASSRFYLPHSISSLPNDLTRLPEPIYQNKGLEPNEVILIIPDQPTEAELSAALMVAQTLGRMTWGELKLRLSTVNQLTPQDLENSHIILIGKPSTLSLLNLLSLPAPVSGSTFNIAGITPEDGVVQMASSPWNPLRIALVVSGETDVAMVKAAFAIQSGNLLPIDQPNLALVIETNPEEVISYDQTDRSFASLGYSKEVIQGLGVHKRYYSFYVPPGTGAAPDAYLNLHYSHSTLLDYWRSGMVISLNGEPIGSVRFDDETSQSGNVRVAIVHAGVRPGNNTISVEVNLIPRDYCSKLLEINTWLTIHDDSYLHIPTTPLSATSGALITNLNNYPNLLMMSATQNKLVFIMPNDPVSWKVAAKLASDLGNLSSWGLPNIIKQPGESLYNPVQQNQWSFQQLSVLYDGNFTPESIEGSNLIIVGRPSMLSVLNYFKDQLTIQFEPGSDTPIQENLPVIFRAHPEKNEGFIELISTPSENRPTIIAVLGNSEQGLIWSSEVLISPELRNQLRGNYAYVYGNQVVSGKIDLTTKKEVGLPASDQEEVGTRTSLPTSYRPIWLLPALGLLGLLIIVIIFIAAINNVLKKSKQ